MAWLWGICRGYGRMAGLWGSGVAYGEMRQACGRMGEPRYHMGRWPVWGAVESHGKPRKRMGIRGAWGSAGRGLQCMACEMWDCGLCSFL